MHKCDAAAGKTQPGGAKINFRGAGDITPLTRASFCGHEAIVRLLLSRGAKQELQSFNGGTALHYAVDGDQPGVITLLCAAPGAAAALALRINTITGTCTPLTYAIHRGHAACEAALRAAGAPE